MKKVLREKFARLQEIIGRYDSAVLALSGGKDSALVLFAANEALGKENILAVTALSPIRRAEDIWLASKLGQSLKIDHRLVYTKEVHHPHFIDPERRCLICKDELFGRLERLRGERGFRKIADGTNLDDSREERPVFAISKKYGIRWPLVEAEIYGSDAESLLLSLGLKEFVRPHYSCSASRLGRKRLLEYQKRNGFTYKRNAL